MTGGGRGIAAGPGKEIDFIQPHSLIIILIAFNTPPPSLLRRQAPWGAGFSLWFLFTRKPPRARALLCCTKSSCCPEDASP